MQDVDRPANVQALSQPARHRCPCVQVKPLRLVPRSQSVDGIGGHRSRRRDFRHEPAVRPPEGKHSVGLPVHLEALFVDRAVVATTEQREVRQCGRAAVRPVADVMTLTERKPAARKATAAIAMVKRAA